MKILSLCFFVLPFDALIESNEIVRLENAKAGDRLTIKRHDVYMVGCSAKTLTTLVYIYNSVFQDRHVQPADFSGYMGTLDI